MTELNPETFNVADMFTGVAYPKDTVKVYTNEEPAYRLAALNKRIAREIADEGVRDELSDEAVKLLAEVNKYRYTFHLTGIGEDTLKAIVEKARQAHPSKYGTFGQELPNPEQDEYFNNLLWAVHTEKIEAPNGAVIVAPGDDQMKIIRGNLPRTQQAKIKDAIDAFSTGSAAGFEAAAQEADFLSQA